MKKIARSVPIVQHPGLHTLLASNPEALSRLREESGTFIVALPANPTAEERAIFRTVTGEDSGSISIQCEISAYALIEKGIHMFDLETVGGHKLVAHIPEDCHNGVSAWLAFSSDVIDPANV
jgi:hypothetical protein